VVRGTGRSEGVSNAHNRARLVTYALQILQSVELRAQPSVYTQELLVHDSSERERTKGVHAGFVDSLGVLVLAFELEREVVGQMATFVVTAQQPERVGVPDFQRPKVENTLQTSAWASHLSWGALPRY